MYLSNGKAILLLTVFLNDLYIKAGYLSIFDTYNANSHLALMNQVDVLCIGYACWDLNFHIPTHPGPDGKAFANSLTSEGGGPAANAAYAIARLGGRAALMGRLGNDPLGKCHLAELHQAGVDTSCILITDTATSTSSIWVDDQGQRSIVNYKPQRTERLPMQNDFTPQCLLMDGHEFEASIHAITNHPQVPSILDAGSLREETKDLATKVTHLVASTIFARDISGSEYESDWLKRLAELSPFAAVTAGEKGVYWQSKDGTQGSIKAAMVDAIDTTAAGDIFHGACALAIAKGKSFQTSLAWANEVAGVSVTYKGGRRSSPTLSDVPTLDNFTHT